MAWCGVAWFGLVWFGWCAHKALAFKNLTEGGIFLNFGSCRTPCNECPDLSQRQSIKRGIFETQCVCLRSMLRELQRLFEKGDSEKAPNALRSHFFLSISPPVSSFSLLDGCNRIV